MNRVAKTVEAAQDRAGLPVAISGSCEDLARTDRNAPIADSARSRPRLCPGLWLRWLVFLRVRVPVAVLAGALAGMGFCPAIAFAQRGCGRGFAARREPSGPVQMDEQTMIDVSTEILHLSDAQKMQMQAIFDGAVKTATPVAAQMEGSQNLLFDAVKAGKSEQEIKDLATQQGALRGQLLLLQAQTFSKLSSILTAQQKGEAGILIYDGIGQFVSGAHAPAPVNLPNLAVPSMPAPEPNPNPAKP